MGRLMESSDLTNVILIGDVNNDLLESLLQNESSVLQQRNELLLDTKYYVARLKLVSLKTVEMISEWRNSAVNVNVGAVVYNYDGEFRSIEQLKQQMSTWKAEIQVAVCKRLERSAEWSEILYRFCAGEQIELVELDPDAETIDELNECYELYGIPRIRQVLEAGNWSGKAMKINPLELNEKQNFKKIGLPISSPAKKSSEDSSEEVEAEDNDPAVTENLKQKAEKLNRQNNLSAGKRRKKKESEILIASEFGEFVSAGNSRQISHNVLTQGSLNSDSPHIEDRNVDVNIDEEQEASNSNSSGLPEKSEENPHPLNSVSRSVIDGLFDKGAVEQGASLVDKIHAARSAILEMPFGPERQNLAADTMLALIDSIGDSDLFNSSSDEEPHI